MNKKTISIILAYVGVLTGAGLASGQELMQYFVSFGKPGIFGLIVVGILHIFVGGIILQLGSHFIAESHIDVLEEVSEKFVTKFMDFALLLNCFFNGLCNDSRCRLQLKPTIWFEIMGGITNMYNINYSSRNDGLWKSN